MRMSHWLLFVVLVFCACLAPLCGAQTVANIYNFTGVNGLATPERGTLAQGRNGLLYGAATGLTSTFSSDGAVFRFNPAGSVTALYTFGSTSGGAEPGSSVLLSTDGNFYGTTFGGGISLSGNVFKVAPNGAYTSLHQFNGDGAYPEAAPVEASDGNLYGTTMWNTNLTGGYGTVYKYTPSGVFSTVYNFDSTHGAIPESPLIQAADGNLYGTTAAGGAANCGTIFKITTSGTLLYSYSFQGGAAGCEPTGPMIQATDGNFYGTTLGGDTPTDFGTILRLSKSGTVYVLYRFLGGTTDGAYPVAGLLQVTDGNLYGTTGGGGAYGNGTIFKITPSGHYTLLYNFSTDVGETPYAPLSQSTNGMLYGTTTAGGSAGDGTLYSLDIGLGPFVTFVLPTGRVGQATQILGQGLTGTTSVSFNGVAATSFKVITDTYMTAVVPSGATTGKVVVTTPGGTLTSNVSFRIVQ